MVNIMGVLVRGLIFATIASLASVANAQRPFEQNILHGAFGYDRSTQSSVDVRDIHQGCSRRDCIRSIDRPKYVTAAEADHVAEDDIVLALSLKGYHRAWPAKILDQHEIVNDIIAGTPIAITWCPLCGSAVGVIREFDGQVTEFGVSGLLYNSDLVFYDRKTKTLWDQVLAKGIVGPLTGKQLQLVPITMTRWGRWKKAHPDTLVLSEDTGFRNNYSVDPYRRYRGSNRLMFPVAKRSDVIAPKSVVYGFAIGDRTVAFTDSLLEQTAEFTHEPDGEQFVVKVAADGKITMTNAETGAVHSPVRLYWFSWYTFHPETELVQQPG